MKHVQLNKNSQAGFSLVELMVVVAIIGILASLAIPSVGKYMAKARQSEAKTQLASLYTAEKAFYAEYTAYDSRFGAIGYSPEGQLRYNVGFGANGFQAAVGNGYTFPASASAAISTALPGNYCGTVSGTMSNGCTILNGADGNRPVTNAGAAVTTINTFIAQANARIHASAGVNDVWQITHEKILTNPTSGIP